MFNHPGDSVAQLIMHWLDGGERDRLHDVTITRQAAGTPRALFCVE
jgi:hypothetical protein